jgi:hypothetical protein
MSGRNLPLNQQLLQELATLKRALGTHRLARTIRDLDGLRAFMEHHVVCVWDFMSLLKSLQRDLSCVTVPWVPPVDAEAARLVNELVLTEETDEMPGAHNGRYASHFDWYLQAMEEVGCDREPIHRFLTALRCGENADVALRSCGFPIAATDFARHSLEILHEPLPVRVSVFFYGREDLIPDLLEPVAAELHREHGTGRRLLDYLNRHAEVDRDRHGPMCGRLLARQLEQHPDSRQRALDKAASALRARLKLWNAIADRCADQWRSRDLMPTP